MEVEVAPLKIAMRRWKAKSELHWTRSQTNVRTNGRSQHLQLTINSSVSPTTSLRLRPPSANRAHASGNGPLTVKLEETAGCKSIVRTRASLSLVTSNHITSHHITSRYTTPHHITSNHTTPHHTTSHHTTPHHITLHHITSHHITSHHTTSHHTTSHHTTSHHITPHHTTPPTFTVSSKTIPL